MRNTLKKILAEKSLSIRGLARLSGISRSQLNNYINGKKELSWKNVQKLAKLFNIQLPE